MDNLMDLLTSQLAGNQVDELSNHLGADKQQVESAIGTALPLLFSALAKNTQTEEGANALAGALERDHDGSVLDNISSLLGGKKEELPVAQKAVDGSGILKHLLGGKRGMLEGLIGQNSGLSQEKTSGLMELLAPMVLGQLGRQKKQSGLDASGIASLLGGMMNQNQKKAPKSMGLLNSLLDQDGDGSINDDVASIGMKFLGNMFRKR